MVFLQRVFHEFDMDIPNGFPMYSRDILNGFDGYFVQQQRMNPGCCSLGDPGPWVFQGNFLCMLSSTLCTPIPMTIEVEILLDSFPNRYIFKGLFSHITDMHRAMAKRAEYIFCLLLTLKQKDGFCPFQISHV